MPRYFFNVYDGSAYQDNLQSTELNDLNGARREAVRFAAALLSDGADKFWSAKRWQMDVRDEYGLLLFTLRFAAEETPGVGGVPYKGARSPSHKA